MSKLGVLTCGRIGTRGGDLASCLRHLSATISVLERSLRRGGMKRHASERLVAPFLVRSLVEVACTALIGHLDPFRILTLAQVQGRGNYDPSQRTASALKWQGDVLSLDGKSKNPWDSTKKPEQMSRALLGDYQDSIFWQPSFVRFLDHMQTTTAQSQWLSELINTEPTQFVPQLRGKALKLYSTASKGVHHEFVLP